VPPSARAPLGHEVDPDHGLRTEVLRDPRAHLADRPEPEHGDAAALGNRRVLHGLPGGREDVGEEQEAVVGRALGNLDRPVVRLRDAQQLRLTAGHLPVELGVAEQRRALVLVAHLRRLALRLEAAVAHPTVPAGDVEGDDDAVAGREAGHVGTDLLDHAHRLVAEDVALAEVGREHLVEVEIRATQARRGDADDRIGGLLDAWIGDGVDADVAPAVEGERPHLSDAPIVVSRVSSVTTAKGREVIRMLFPGPRPGSVAVRVP